MPKGTKHVCVLIGAAMLITYCVFGFRDLMHQTHARRVLKECVTAKEHLEQSEPGIESVRLFARRLKSIDTQYAPNELKSAVYAYASALEESIEAVAAGKNWAAFDERIHAEKKKLVALSEKYQ